MIPEWVYQQCPGISDSHREVAAARQSQLTKPTGSLGRLEQVAIDLAGMQQTERPRANNVPIVIFAADHGIAAKGVSAYSQEVTIAMMANYVSGGAAISVLARELGSSLEVVDVGSLAQSPMPGIVTDKPRCGSRDFSEETALEPADLTFALDCGRRAVLRAGEADLFIFGEMGIGNTTASAAIAASLLGVRAEEVVGNGTGVDAAGRRKKARLIDLALDRHGLNPATPPERILSAVGGLEIAAICGAIIAAAQRRVPILIDGFIVSVAALMAARLNPSCRPFLLPSHQSAEQGHILVLQAVDVQPLISLDLRLGEGSGAAIALPLVRLACALHNDMATFEQANVPDRPAG